MWVRSFWGIATPPSGARNDREGNAECAFGSPVGADAPGGPPLVLRQRPDEGIRHYGQTRMRGICFAHAPVGADAPVKTDIGNTLSNDMGNTSGNFRTTF